VKKVQLASALMVLLLMAGVCAADTNIPVGQTGTVDNWEIKVISFVPDATQQIAAENMFNPKPAAGGQYCMVYLEAKNVGDKEESFNSGNLHLVGASLMVYDTPIMLVVPDAMPSNQAFPGGILRDDIGFDVSSSDIGSLRLYYEPMFSSDKTYFDLS